MKWAVHEVAGVVAKPEAEGHSKLAGAVGQFPDIPDFWAVPGHEADPGDRLDGAQEHGTGHARFFRNHIQQGIHMALVDIGPSGGSEHRRVSFARAPAGVASWVSAAGVGLGLDNRSGNPALGGVMDEEHADKFPGYLQGVAPEE